MYKLREREARSRPPRLIDARWYGLRLGVGGPKRSEGLEAKGHVALICVTRGPQCRLHCSYGLSPPAIYLPRKPFPRPGIRGTTIHARF